MIGTNNLDAEIAALKATDYGAGMVNAQAAYAIIERLRIHAGLPRVPPLMKLSEAPPTRVRCWKSTVMPSIWCMSSDDDGIYMGRESKHIDASAYSVSEYINHERHEEISPTAALDLLRDWPEGRERFIAYCREHPPEAAKPKTVADVLREMPVGARFQRPQWLKSDWCEKIGDDAFRWRNGNLYRQYEFLEQDAPADNPERGITVLPAAEPVEQPAGVTDGDDMRKRYVARLEQIRMLMKDNEKLRVIAGEYHDEAQRLRVELGHLKSEVTRAVSDADARRKAGG